VLNAILLFLEYLGVAVALLVIFTVIYAQATPYKEFTLIEHDNNAVAVVLAGAVLGFTIPLVAAIVYTRSLLEMIVWGAITGAVQLLVLLVLRKQARRVEQGHLASAIMVASFSVAVGLLNAASISN
jgi:putative membrane protein